MPISATKRLKHSRVRQRNKLHDAKMIDLREIVGTTRWIYIYIYTHEQNLIDAEYNSVFYIVGRSVKEGGC